MSTGSRCCSMSSTTTPAGSGAMTRASSSGTASGTATITTACTSPTSRRSGGLVFAYWNQDVRQFLIDNAIFFTREYHVDGFRFDQVTIIDDNGGWQFCQDLTDTLHFLEPLALLIAEYWADQIRRARHRRRRARLRRGLVGRAARHRPRGARPGRRRCAGPSCPRLPSASLNLPPGFPAPVEVGRVPSRTTTRCSRAGARGSPASPIEQLRSWYARSRSRVATGLILTAPGIPMLFMGQEFLEDKQWSDSDPNLLICWDGVEGTDKAMVNHLRFTRELIALRRHQPALRGGGNQRLPRPQRQPRDRLPALGRGGRPRRGRGREPE